MEPVTIILGAGAALLLLKGLAGSSPNPSVPTPADAATQQGASEIVQVGQAGVQSTQQLQGVASQTSSAAFKTTVGAAGAGVSAGVAAAGAAGTSAGIIAGSVTFGIGAVVGLAVVLWSKHEARIKGAKNEDAAMNVIAAGWKQSMQGIIAAYNSGQINDLTCAAELQQLRDLVLASAQKYNHVPGVDWSGGGTQAAGTRGTKYFTAKCDKHCTVGCCLFNNIIGPGTNNAISMVTSKTVKTITIPSMASSKYGFTGAPSFQLSIK